MNGEGNLDLMLSLLVVGGCEWDEDDDDSVGDVDKDVVGGEGVMESTRFSFRTGSTMTVFC